MGLSEAALQNSDSDRAPFLAFLADAESETALRAGVAGSLDQPQIRRGNLRAAVRALEREPTPRVLLVDISGLDNPISELDKLAAVCTPDVCVLVVGDRSDISFYQELTREVGVAEYINKPLTRERVASLFGPHLAIGGTQGGGAEGTRGGRVVAVCGARGGVGATTIAVNLALDLASTTHGHVALLDLHLQGGTTAMMLGAKPGAGLRLALEDPERADALFLDRVALPVEDRLRLIAAEEPFEAQPRPSPEALQRLLDLLRQRFNHIVLDMPVPPDATGRQALASSALGVIVFGADLASLRDAEALRKMLAVVAPNSQPILVLNRANAPGALTPALVREGLGRVPDATIPNLPRHLPRAANLGRPALKDSAAFRKALAPLTQEVSGAQTEAEPTRMSLLRKVLGR